MNKNEYEEIYSNEFLTTSIGEIYSSITFIDKNFNFEELSKEEFCIRNLENVIKKYNIKLLTLSKDDIVKLPNIDTMLNQLFVIYLKSTLENGKKNRFNDIMVIFNVFCEYFDFEYHYIYVKLHQKIQDIIKKQLISRIGINCFKKYEKQFSTQNDNKILTLFDLCTNTHNS